MTNAPFPAPATRPGGRWYRWRALPHFEAEGLAQAVTFRLQGSLPPGLVEAWDAQLSQHPPAMRQRVLQRRVELYLDAGDPTGETWLARPDIAGKVCGAFRFFDRVRYDLHAWVVMSNHAHVFFTPKPGFLMSDIVRSWKSFSGKEANRILGRQGVPFWHRDYFDRYIRDDEHFARVMDYIANNPVKAGLCARAEEWPWSSAATTDPPQ